MLQFNSWVEIIYGQFMADIGFTRANQGNLVVNTCMDNVKHLRMRLTNSTDASSQGLFVAMASVTMTFPVVKQLRQRVYMHNKNQRFIPIALPQENCPNQEG